MAIKQAKTFYKYNIGALTATFADFLILTIFTELFHAGIFYATLIGALTGGTVSFILERNWVFKKQEKNAVPQVIKYSIGCISSIFLNTYGVVLIVTYTSVHYMAAKIITAVLVGIFFNYQIRKRIVFK